MRTRTPTFIVTSVVITACSGSPYQTQQAKNPPQDPAPVAVSPRTKPGDAGNTSDPLPKPTRDSLRAQMFEHGQNMDNLLWAAMMLDYERMRKIAEWIIERSDSATLRSSSPDIPHTFFALRDQLGDSAQRLREAALARNDTGIASSYGDLAESCIRCHSKYLFSWRPESRPE